MIYRLVRVVYAVVFILIICFSLIIAWTEKPTKYVDDERSVLICNNGNQTRLSKAKVHVFDINATEAEYYEEEARKFCAYGFVNDDTVAYRNLYTPTYQNYKLNIVTETNGSWKDVILVVIIPILVSYPLLNIVRETLNYIFLGKKFDWLWLTWLFNK